MAKLNNRFWFKLHGWFSLPVWLLFCFVCLTGTIAVLSHELTWLTNPNARAENPNHLPQKSVAELHSIMQEEHPTADVSIIVAMEPYLVNVAYFTDSDKPYALAYINQYTGEIQEINQGVTFVGFMRSLHSWLLFPWPGNYSIGYYLVCAMAIVMLGALITGLVIYKKFWRSFLAPKIRLNQGKQTLLADLHRLSGVWSIWFLILMSVTGLWYLAQAIMWHAQYDIEPHAPLVNIEQLPANMANKPVPPTSLDDAMQIAQQRFPDFQPTYTMLPEHNRDTYKLIGQGDYIFYDQYAYNITINPWTGEVESEKSPESMTPLQTVMHVADPLHYGTIGGIWTKIIWFLFGLILSGMSITGFMMWGGRVVKAARRDVSLEPTSAHAVMVQQELNS